MSQKTFLFTSAFLLSATLRVPIGSAQGLPEPICQDFVLRLPTPSPTNPGNGRFFARDSLLYFIKALLPGGTPLPWISEDEMRLPCGLLSSSAHSVLQTNTDSEGYLDRSTFYAQIAPVYRDEVRTLHYAAPLQQVPDTWEAFTQLYPIGTWPREVIPRSGIKDLTRAIYSSPAGVFPRMHVAHTHQSETGDLSRPVRETEIIIKRSNDPVDWDFFVYDRTGRLVAESEFRAGMRPSPGTCLGCHFRASERGFGPRRP